MQMEIRQLGEFFKSAELPQAGSVSDRFSTSSFIKISQNIQYAIQDYFKTFSI